MTQPLQIEPIKRTTIFVRDMDRSLEYYRGLLGLGVFYDGHVGNPGASQLLGARCEGIHMVVLEADSTPTGKLGLMKAIAPEIPFAELPRQTAMRLGETVLVMPTTNLESLHARMQQRGDVIVTPPVQLDVPGRGPVLEMFARDPDGVLINLTQRLF